MQPLGPAQARAAAEAIAALRHATPLNGSEVNWAGAQMIRARTHDGILLSLQAVPAGEGAQIRITADAPQNATPAVRAKAEAIRGARRSAYRLNTVNARMLAAPTSDSGRR